MPYPFSNSPVEKYLKIHRKYSLERHKQACLWESVDSTPDQKISASKKIKEINESISQLKKIIPIPSRRFDVFRSPFEQAMKKFYSDNPEPLNPLQCSHPIKEKRLKRLKNHSWHLVDQCLRCGKVTEYYKKNNHTDYLKFDETLCRTIQTIHDDWQKEHHKHYVQASFGKDYQEFDYKGFRETYELTYPEPIYQENCSHIHSTTTLRTYKNGATAVVVQCLQCGHHLKSVSKSTVQSIEHLLPFDENLKDGCNQAHSQWCKQFYTAFELAKKEFEVQRQKDIERGGCIIEYNDTFSTYYYSPEWENTRQRIFLRDDHRCQACQKPAECVHHLTYDRLGEENDFDLISLCHACHIKVHNIQRDAGNLIILTPIEISKLNKLKLQGLSVYLSSSESITS